MHLTLSLCRGLPGAPETAIVVDGDIVTVDGVAYDLSAVPEGGEGLPEGANHPFIERITRQSGVIHATLRVMLSDDAEPDQPSEPGHWIIATAEGAVAIPALRRTSQSKESPE